MEASAEFLEERRRERRQPSRYLRFWSPVLGEIIDLSADGMAVKTLDELVAGACYAFKFRRRARVIRLTGRVRWCRAEGSVLRADGTRRTLFKAGIVFVGKGAACAQQLLDP